MFIRRSISTSPILYVISTTLPTKPESRGSIPPLRMLMGSGGHTVPSSLHVRISCVRGPGLPRYPLLGFALFRLLRVPRPSRPPHPPPIRSLCFLDFDLGSWHRRSSNR